MGLLQRYLGDSRGSRVRFSVATGLFAKGFLILAGLIITPLMVRYLGKQGYGLFATITAVVSWLQITNFGIGLGLQNSLTEAVARGNVTHQRALVSTAFFFLLGVTLVLAVVAITSFTFVPWNEIFPATEARYAKQLAPAVAIVLTGFISTFALSFVNAIYAAKQELYLPNLMATVTSALTIVSVLVAIRSDLGLIGVTAATVGTGVLVTWSFVCWYFLRPSTHPLRPSLTAISRPAWHRIFRSSSAFFVIEICVVVLFQTDYFMIAKFLRVDDVTPYSIASKPFTVISVFILSVILQPLWAAYGNAKACGDLAWIRRNHRRVLIAFMSIYALVLAVMVPFGHPLLTLWVGAKAAPGTTLIILTGIYYLIRQWTDLHAILVNGLDMMRPQAISATIHAILTITLEIVLIRRLGVIGVPIACFLGYALVSAWFLPLLAGRSLAKLQATSAQTTASSLQSVSI